MILTKIMKVLKNGTVIRYPEETYSEGIIWEKDYRLNGFPRLNQGGYDLSQSYEEYLDWLQNYLYSADVDLDDEEFRLSQQIANDEKDLNYGSGLGVSAGFYDHFGPELEYPPDTEESFAFATIASFGQNPDALTADRLNGLSVEDFILRDYARQLIRTRESRDFDEYWPDFERYPLHGPWCQFPDGKPIEPCDAGWRVHLSIYLKKFSEKTRRIKELDDFMTEFADNFRK
jgi:hypothetical protein